jgi:hypothetical protein
MDPIDDWRTVDILMKQYGAEAGLIAAKRGDALLAQSEMDGFAVWKRVVSAIAELVRDKPREKPADCERCGFRLQSAAASGGRYFAMMLFKRSVRLGWPCTDLPGS